MLDPNPIWEPVPSYPNQDLEQCSNCKAVFIEYDYGYGENPDMCYAKWDKKKQHPFCSEDCLWEYEEENDIKH